MNAPRSVYPEVSSVKKLVKDLPPLRHRRDDGVRDDESVRFEQVLSDLYSKCHPFLEENTSVVAERKDMIRSLHEKRSSLGDGEADHVDRNSLPFPDKVQPTAEEGEEIISQRMRAATSSMNYNYCLANVTCPSSMAKLRRCWDAAGKNLVQVKQPYDDPCRDLRRDVERCAGRVVSRTAARLGFFGEIND